MVGRGLVVFGAMITTVIGLANPNLERVTTWRAAHALER
jgi:hypothetical protein